MYRELYEELSNIVLNKEEFLSIIPEEEQELYERMAALPDIQHVDLWHDQVDYLSEEHPFATPAVFFGFTTSLSVELLQIFTYRATDVNDLITNTLGTVLGYILGIATLRFSPSLKAKENYNDLYWVVGITFLVMFFIYPFLSTMIQ